MTNKFSDNFWGDTNAGFEVLYQNMKAELTAIKELADCLKEKATLEDQYARGLAKLLKTLAPIQDSALGSFCPFWKKIKEMLEQQVTVHSQLNQALTELGKEVLDYSSALRDKTKANVKGEIETAGMSLITLRNCDAAVVTTKKAYQQACDQQSKLLGKMERANRDPTFTAKTKLTLESKIKQADTQLETSKADHQVAVKKHCECLMEFQGKLSEACQKFEIVEEEYLHHMTGFMGKLSDIQNASHSQMGVLYSSFNESIQEFSVDKLLSLFVEAKGTGKNKPVPFKFRTLQAAPVSITASLVDVRPESPGHIHVEKERHDSASSGGGGGSIFSKKLKKLTKSKTTSTAVAEPSVSPVPSTAVDEEGYSIRPDDASTYGSFPGEKEKTKGQGSDSDSDFDDEPEKNKIKSIRIKPVATPAAVSVNDIKASLQSIQFPGLNISPLGGSSHSLDKLPSSGTEYRNKSIEGPQTEKQPQGDAALSLLDLDHISSVNIPPPLVPSTYNSTSFKAAFDLDMQLLSDNMANPTISLSSVLEPLGTPPSANSTTSGGGVFFGADSAPPISNSVVNIPTFFLEDQTGSVSSGLSDQGSIPSSTAGTIPAFIADFTSPAPPAFSLPPPPSSVAPPPSGVAPPPSGLAPPPSSMVHPPSGVHSITDFSISSGLASQPSANKLPVSTPFPVDFSQGNKQGPSSLPGVEGHLSANKLPVSTPFLVDFSQGNKQEPSSLPGVEGHLSANKLPVSKPFLVDFSQGNKQEPSSLPGVEGQLSTNKLPFPVDFSQGNKQGPSSFPGVEGHLLANKVPPMFSSDFGSSGSLVQPPISQPEPSSSLSTSLSIPSLSFPPPPTASLSFPPPPPSASRERSGSNDLTVGVATKPVPRPRLTNTISKGSPDTLRKVDSVDEVALPPPLPLKKRLRQEEEHQGEVTRAESSEAIAGGHPPAGVTLLASHRAPGGGGVAEGSPLVTTTLKPVPPSAEIPVAVAFIETCNAIFRGTSLEQCLVKVTGEVAVSFPASYLDRLQLCPPLQFRVTNGGMIDKVIPHPSLLQREGDGVTFSFVTDALVSYLKTQTSKTPAAFYNLPVIKYEVKVTDAHRLPLHLASHWKCEPKMTNFRLDYSYNTAAFNNPASITSLSAFVPVNGGVVNTLSKPQAEWIAEKGWMVWKIGDLQPPSPAPNSLQAKFEVQDGPSTPKPAAVQFVCDGVTLSGVGLELIGSGYRLSLLKFKSISGQYSAEAM